MINDDELSCTNTLEIFKPLITCEICKGILIDPIQCQKCNKIFCKKCNINPKNKEKCKFGCQNAQVKPLKIIKNVLSKLKFECKNKCGEVIPYDDYFNHHGKTCKNFNYQENYIRKLNKLMVKKIKEEILIKENEKLLLIEEKRKNYDADYFINNIRRHPRNHNDEDRLEMLKTTMMEYIKIPNINS